MKNLVIHHPVDKVICQGKKSFANCMKTMVGEGFAISKANVAALKAGDNVIVLCSSKGYERRAEGQLEKLVHSGKTGSGLKRYDVFIKDLIEVPYHRSDFGKLNHNGVAIF